MTGHRLRAGGRIDRGRPVSFTFDGRAVSGFDGDTLASALLAKGEMLFGRSFKLHRPRGVVSAGREEPNALVEIGSGEQRMPNRPATTIELTPGLVARSQNRWPSLALDAMAVNGWFAPLLGAGFYYKTFMWPASFWEKFYEPLIRRAAGLGRIGADMHPEHAETVHAHCDVLVVGSGAAGLAAASIAAEAGARVMLVEQDFEMGGGTLLDPAWSAWRDERLAALAGAPDMRIMLRTACISAHEHNVFVAVERASDGSQRLWIIRTRSVVLASGATERLIAFPGNDRPGVMLAGAVLSYLRRHAVACGRRAVLFTNNDEAYETAFALHEAGIAMAAIVDCRGQSEAAERAKAAGLPVHDGHEVCGTAGAPLKSVTIRPVGGGAARTIEADLLCVSGGHNPNVQLASQAQVGLVWDEAVHSFAPGEGKQSIISAGAAKGVFGVAAAALDGERAGQGAANACGFESKAELLLPAGIDCATTPLRPLWQVKATDKRGSKAFVDLQHDVTADDIRLAAREGFAHVEHAKRYTTHGMGTDQGRMGGLVGSAVLAEARGISVAEVGLPRFRPYVTPAPWGALAGADVGAHFKPERRLPLHDWHEANSAVFVRIGLWMRPLVYSKAGDTSWGPVLAEARTVRRSVGLTDVSSLGKIDVQGPDAAAFLDLIYANTISTIPVGRARYGLMLREDGMVFDDGTVARFAADHFVLSTTTQKADDVLAHLEWHAATVWPELDVSITNIGDHWAQFALAGPKARDVLQKVLPGVELSNESFPFMAVAPVRVHGVGARLFRISFSGELAYELAVSARHAKPVWEALLAAGAENGIVPYGLDALNLMRVEKGHVAGSELDGTTTAADLGLGRMLKKNGDFIGRVMSQRPGLLAASRKQLVGIRPVDTGQRLRNGAHLIRGAGQPSEGYLTACCMASEGEGWLGLALLVGGQARHGERMIAASPIYKENVEVTVTSPHALDPENARVRV